MTQISRRNLSQERIPGGSKYLFLRLRRCHAQSLTFLAKCVILSVSGGPAYSAGKAERRICWSTVLKQYKTVTYMPFSSEAFLLRKIVT